MAIGKVAAHLCLALIVKELKINVAHGRVVTTLNIIFCVVDSLVECYTQVYDMEAIYFRDLQRMELL